MNIPNQQIFIDKYGENYCTRIAMEECAELIQAINKMSRLNRGYKDYNSAKDNLTEEMADVLICMEQLKMIYDVADEDIQLWVNQKYKRALKRLEE